MFIDKLGSYRTVLGKRVKERAQELCCVGSRPAHLYVDDQHFVGSLSVCIHTCNAQAHIYYTHTGIKVYTRLAHLIHIGLF